MPIRVAIHPSMSWRRSSSCGHNLQRGIMNQFMTPSGQVLDAYGDRLAWPVVAEPTGAFRGERADVQAPGAGDLDQGQGREEGGLLVPTCKVITDQPDWIIPAPLCRLDREEERGGSTPSNSSMGTQEAPCSLGRTFEAET